MRLGYDVTGDDYACMVEFQMRLKNRSLGQLARLWITNGIFLCLAIYFFVARAEYGLWVRLAPFAMAAVLLAISLRPRFNIEKRARRTVEAYQRNHTLQEGYIGPHLLVVENGVLGRWFGDGWTQVECSRAMMGTVLDRVTLILADGVIFEAVPNRALDASGGRERLMKALEEGRKINRQEVAYGILADMGGCQLHLEWEIPISRSAALQTAGLRAFYQTRLAWNQSQVIRAVILGYGLVVLLGGLNAYLGAAFTLLGLWLNRSALFIFTPLARTAGRQLSDGADAWRIRGDLFVSDGQIALLAAAQVQTARLSEIAAVRESAGGIFLYTRQSKMLAVPGEAFPDRDKREELIGLLKYRK